MARLIVFVLALPLVLSGCYAYRVFPTAYRHFETPPAVEKVYVINPELKKEYEIIRASGIYQLTNDSTNQKKIKLYPLKSHFVCGQPLVGSMIFLGQLPVYLPDQYVFKFDEQRDSAVISHQFELKITKRYWFWDMFTFQKDFKKFAGKALAGNYYGGNLVVK